MQNNMGNIIIAKEVDLKMYGTECFILLIGFKRTAKVVLIPIQNLSSYRYPCLFL